MQSIQHLFLEHERATSMIDGKGHLISSTCGCDESNNTSGEAEPSFPGRKHACVGSRHDSAEITIIRNSRLSADLLLKVLGSTLPQGARPPRLPASFKPPIPAIVEDREC